MVTELDCGSGFTSKGAIVSQKQLDIENRRETIENRQKPSETIQTVP